MGKLCARTAFDRLRGSVDDGGMNRGSRGLEALPRLWRHEAIRVGLRRVLLTCLQAARAAMAGQPASEDVHQARIALKRARAVLRLGDACGMAWTAPARRRLAKLARELAAARDGFVVAKTARRLAVKLAGRARLGAAGLVSRRAARTGGLNWAAWSRRLAAEQRRLAAQPWPALTRRELERALARSVRRLRKRELDASAGGESAALHEWRKAVIVLREQFNVLRPLRPQPQQCLAGQLHRVARKLGAAQDCHLLIVAAQRTRTSAGRAQLVSCAVQEWQRAVARARHHWAKVWPALRDDFELA